MDSEVFKKSTAGIIFKDVISCAFAVFIIVTLILNQKAASLGVINGISFSIHTLIPSLFPFMFVSSFIVKSTIINSVGRIFAPLTKFLFYLPGCAAPAIILGMIGGYPTGVKNVQNLLERDLINREQANRLMCFNVNAGPGFIISLVGGIFLKSISTGILIFLSQISFAVFLGILLGLNARIHNYELHENSASGDDNTNMTDSIIQSCNDAVNSTINMCSLVTLFYCILFIINSFLRQNSNVFPPIVQLIVPVILEVNSACSTISNSIYSPSLMTFAIGWGGICVHLQIISVIIKEKNIKIFNFVLFRLIHALGSAGLVYIITRSECLPVSSVQNSCEIPYGTASLSTSLSGSFALILFCLYFINSLKSTKAE